MALAVTIPLLMIIGSSKGKSLPKGKLSITNLSDKYEEMGNSVKGSIMHPKELKKFNKESAKKKKKKKKRKMKSMNLFLCLISKVIFKQLKLKNLSKR